jgi:hypothetical protein
MDSYNHFQGKAPPYTPMVYTPLQQQRHIIWRPGFFRRAPWGALTALLLAIICAFASAIIIFISHEHAATWKWQPSVLLGFLASFSAAMLLAAFISGVRITWWRAALHGASLAQLHHIWNHGGGGGVISLLSAWRHANKVALASILTTIAGLAYRYVELALNSPFASGSSSDMLWWVAMKGSHTRSKDITSEHNANIYQ